MPPPISELENQEDPLQDLYCCRTVKDAEPSTVKQKRIDDRNAAHIRY